LFSGKNLQEKHFFHGNTAMIGIQTRFSDQFQLFYISLQQKVRSFAFVFWKNDESLDVPKETSLFN
jgi:hypothetical protein